MEFLAWFTEAYTFQDVATIAGLLFAGLELRRNTKSRQVSNLLETTKQHRELWTWIYSRPELKRTFDPHADLLAQGISDEEQRSISFVILHLAANYRAAREGMFRLPGKIGADIRGFFSRPVPRGVWDKLKQFHEEDFVRFVEKNWESL